MVNHGGVELRRRSDRHSAADRGMREQKRSASRATIQGHSVLGGLRDDAMSRAQELDAPNS